MTRQIVRRDPFEMFMPVEKIMSRIFADPTIADLPTIEEGALAMDISETPEHLVVRASLPGFKKEDVNVEVHDGVLTISATRAETSETSDEKFYRRERRMGSVSRRVALPTAVSEDEASAELNEGVLVLKLPKSRKDSPKRISVN